ncbi:amino acid ABC transporter permease [Variovorax ureilyticus]|uniref:Amino acid ABC transporter permease n=1 Tax=Variovorax ureilyticus TaxID=1836198 RepID=A0ABU8VN54_9BURK
MLLKFPAIARTEASTSTRADHFNGVSLVATAAAAIVIAYLAWLALRWAILDATWTAASANECTSGGACWAVLRARYRIILFGLYPYEEHWRPAVACILVVAAVLFLQWSKLWRLATLLWAAAAVGIAFVLLMRGGLFGLPYVSTDRWGGFALTLFLYLVGVLLGMPTGIALALMRRSPKGLLAGTAAFIVDAVRTLPMVMILFTVGVLAPIVFPGSLSGDKLWRVAIAFAFVYGCYQSEIVRAGLQAIPRQQEEAAKALALNQYMRLRLVLLPQALTNGLPATVNLLVATFKETSIVAIIGFFDFTASAQTAYGNAEWANAYLEVYIFVGFVYFSCATGLGSLGRRLERRLRQGGA